MIVPGSVNPLLLATGGYDVPYSLRFRAANSAYLSRTGSGTPTSTTTFTYSVWAKLGAAVAASFNGELISGYTASNDAGYGALEFNTASGTGTLRFSGWTTVYRVTSAVYRDPSAWYHIVLAVDTTQGTAANRIKIYINGAEVTSFSTSNNPSASATVGINNTSTALRIGSDNPASSSRLYDGYMAEVNFIDGQALTPSSFGQTDSATGVWVPKKYSGTYGTNGFYLKFADASAATATAIGKDSSGNGNNFTPSGISVTSGVTYDQMTDTPTLNYPVWNPLEYDAGLTTQSTPTFADANMKFTGTGGSGNVCTSRSSIGVKTGKWYWETVIVAINGNYPVIGVMSSQPYDRLTSSGSYMGQSATTTMGYSAGGSKLQSNSLTAYGNTFAANDVISVALDLDNQKIWFAKNGTWQASGDPAAGTNAAFSGFTVPTDGISAALSGYQSTGASGNFGQRAFAYTPPTGFKALNTTNIASAAVTTSGSFTGNAAADGPFIWANGNPATLTINGNAVTFGTHADKTAGGFKLRTSSASYNTSGTNNWTATAGKRFVQSKKPNNAQVNP